MGNNSSSTALPIQTTFKLPSSIPSWPSGDGFGSGMIELGGGLQVYQITSFNKIWTAYEGGPNNLGASFFEPSPTQIPNGFSMLGTYAQPNNRSLHGWVLVAKTTDTTQPTLQQPVDYTLVWTSESLKIKQDRPVYIWLPTPPTGFKAVGHVITNSATKPPLDKIRCVRSDLTDECEHHTWIWGPTGDETDLDGFNIFTLWPTNRSVGATGVSVGTFVAKKSLTTTSNADLACLKNININTFSSMPNPAQVQAVFKHYSPWIYFHPEENYLASSVSWYFRNGALLYKKGEESTPVPIDPTGSNLPQGGSNDGAYWLDLPVDPKEKEAVKRGDLSDFEAYLHAKPMLGATFTDIAVWIFYPFNGPGIAKVNFINKIPLGKIGQHVGDWEHLTLRISNFNGELWSLFFSQHSGGSWVEASELEFMNGNKPVAYSALSGHAMYAKPGLVLQGAGSVGIRNDSGKSEKLVDTGAKFSLVSGGEYLGGGIANIVEPPWLNYFREWGPRISRDLDGEIKNIQKLLPSTLKSALEKLVKSLPKEVLGEEGPTGPKMKRNWSGDEI